MRARKPSVKQVLAKLNEGVSGEGNAVIDLTGLPPVAGNLEGRAPASPGLQASQSSALPSPAEKALLEERLRAMQFELAGITYDSYMEKLQERKGVVEERIMGEEIRSPSVQLRVTPLGVVELLSTHDQLLGGAIGAELSRLRIPG